MVTLPFTRNEIVLSKYIFALITSAIGAVVGEILNIVIQLIRTGTVEYLSRTLSVAILGIIVYVNLIPPFWSIISSVALSVMAFLKLHP